MGDRAAAMLCGVLDTGNREDAYTRIYEAMVEYLGESSKISRNDVKDAIMTALYGSEAVPKQVFGEGELLEVFFAAMALMAPHVWELNQAFLALWNPDAVKYSWVLPDNFHVHTKVVDKVIEEVVFDNANFKVVRKVNQPVKKGRSLGANITHSCDAYIVREIVRRCSYDPEQIMKVKMALCSFSEPSEEMDQDKAAMVQCLWNHYEETGMLSARIFDYIDEDTVSFVKDRGAVFRLIYSLPLTPFQVLTIHDCFRILPGYGNDLRQQYNNMLSELARGNLLNNILSQLLDRPISIEKIDPNMWVEVLHANYALS